MSTQQRQPVAAALGLAGVAVIGFLVGEVSATSRYQPWRDVAEKWEDTANHWREAADRFERVARDTLADLRVCVRRREGPSI